MRLSGQVGGKQIWFTKTGVLRFQCWKLADKPNTEHATIIREYNVGLYPTLTAACEQFELDKAYFENINQNQNNEQDFRNDRVIA